MKRTVSTAALAAGLAVAAVVAAAPRPEGGRTIEELVEELRASDVQGWELVDAATRAVHQAFDHHSYRHLWEDAATAVAHGRGWSAQYNGALALVLTRLGFRVQVVHAARVRGLGSKPWWRAGHTWLRVTHDGRTLDVCARTEGNLPGRVGFVPTSEVRPMHRWTRALVSLAFTPMVLQQALRQRLGLGVAEWLYGEFHPPR